MKLTMLGCGGSGGVPLAGRDPGGYWGSADPANPKNRRSRVSVLIEGQGSPGGDTTRTLIDTAPDLRQQILATGLHAPDPVMCPHAPAHHTQALRDLPGLSHGASALAHPLLG